MNPSERYRGYVISWQQPPLTAAGLEMKIASNEPDLQNRLEDHSGIKGAHVIRARTVDEGLKSSKQYIDRMLA